MTVKIIVYVVFTKNCSDIFKFIRIVRGILTRWRRLCFTKLFFYGVWGNYENKFYNVQDVFSTENF